MHWKTYKKLNPQDLIVLGCCNRSKFPGSVRLLEWHFNGLAKNTCLNVIFIHPVSTSILPFHKHVIELCINVLQSRAHSNIFHLGLVNNRDWCLNVWKYSSLIDTITHTITRTVYVMYTIAACGAIHRIFQKRHRHPSYVKWIFDSRKNDTKNSDF